MTRQESSPQGQARGGDAWRTNLRDGAVGLFSHADYLRFSQHPAQLPELFRNASLILNDGRLLHLGADLLDSGKAISSPGTFEIVAEPADRVEVFGRQVRTRLFDLLQFGPEVLGHQSGHAFRNHGVHRATGSSRITLDRL